MAMGTLAGDTPVWRDRYRRELAQDEYEAELAAAAARAQSTVPQGFTTQQSQETTPPITTPVDRTTPPVSTQDPNAPVYRTPDPTDPSVPRAGTTPATGGSTGSGSRFGTTPITNRGSGTGASNVPYTGFDFTQDANNRLLGKSAKYTLANAVRLATEGGVGDIWKTKEGAQYFAENYIKPYFEEHGFEVLQIVGDKMFVRDHADRAAGRPGSWIDWVVGAGGDNPQIGFQVDSGATRSGEPGTYDTTRFGQRQTIEGLNQFTPQTTSTTTTPRGGMTPDERVYDLLARREERRMARLAGTRGI